VKAPFLEGVNFGSDTLKTELRHWFSASLRASTGGIPAVEQWRWKGWQRGLGFLFHCFTRINAPQILLWHPSFLLAGIYLAGLSVAGDDVDNGARLNLGDLRAAAAG